MGTFDWIVFMAELLGWWQTFLEWITPLLGALGIAL